MTDSFEPASQFDAPSAFTGGSAFLDLDAQRVEKNFEAVDLVEQVWGQPALPDLVKLDLITSPYATPESLTSTLSGIDEEFRRPTAQPDGAEEQAPPGQQLSGLDQARIVVAAMTSNPPPRQVTGDATERFKLRAIDAGLLDMDPGRVGAEWTPELNRVRSELAFQDYNDAQRGSRPGALPFGRAVQVLGDLTSPAGLLSFATDLDLFWDFDAIGDEFGSWGDKVRKLTEEGMSKGPLNFAKNFVDALTGPVDDIVFPVINVGLMFTGFGAMTNVGRVGWMGRNLARAAGTFERVWGESRIGRQLVSGLRGIGEGLEAGARFNLDEIGRPSMIAERLRRGSRAIDEATGLPQQLERGGEAWQALGRGTRFAAWNGDQLARWRAAAPVVGIKRGVQQGMRLGLVSYAQDAFPGYQGGGASLSDIPGVDSFADRMYDASLDPRFLPLELMFAPYNIFAPGTFFRRGGQGTALVARGGRTTRKALGSTGGRAVAGGLAGGAVGALAGDDAGDVAKGAAIGAAGGALLPAIGRGLEVERIHQAATGALIGAGAGLVLGDSPEDVALGALAGTGIVALPANVRKRVYNQVGVSGLDRLLRGVGHAMVRTNYQLVEADAEVSMGFHAKMQRLLADAPDELKQWDMDVNSYGVVGALAKRSYGKVDKDTRNLAAATIGFDYTTFALDWLAHAQSSIVQGTRRQRHAFHMARNKLVNQLRPVDLDRPVEDIVDDLAKIIAWTDTRGARGVATVEDFGNAPRFVDQTGDALFKVRRRQREVAAELANDPERAVRLAEEHNKQIGDTIQQLFEQKNFPRPDDMEANANLFGSQWAEMDMSARSTLFANHGGYSNFGDYREFAAATDEVRRARVDGIFDPATLLPVRTRRGRLRAPKAGVGVDFFDPTSSAAARAVSDMIARGIDPQRLGNLKVTPWASAHEAGRVTPARLDFVTKQMIEEKADEIADILSIRRLFMGKFSPQWRERLRAVGEQADMARATAAPDELEALTAEVDEVARLAGAADGLGARALSEMNMAELRTLLQALVKGGVGRSTAKRVMSFARHHKLRIDDVSAALDRMGDALLDQTDWVRYGFGNVVTNADGKMLKGAEALGARLRELKDKAPFTAAELDMDGLARYYDEAGDAASAARVRALKDEAAARGYKHVHGVEFLAPEDVAFSMPTFADATRRHMNAVTLGNWFGRRQPIEAWARDDRRRRLALVGELARVNRDLNPADKEVTNILDVAERWLRLEQDNAAESLRLAHYQGGIAEKTTTRIRSSLVPVRLDDAAGISRRKQALLDEMRAIGYNDDESLAIWKAVSRFRNSDFQEVGLYGIEAELRNRNQAAGFLKMLAGTRYGDSVIRRAGGQAATGAAVGAVAAGDDASFEDRLKAAVLGAGVAAGVAAPISKKAIAASEGWRYGHLVDGYARLRDSLRFTLSPMFDLSRYTEGIALSQTAVPARRADGSRLAVPALTGGGLVPVAGMSPRGLRRRLARAAMKADKNLTTTQAKRQALVEYEGFVDEFGAAARASRDFDRDAIDSVGGWYRQVGIIGFSPTDWMATAYATLRGEGFGTQEAYKAAREMFMYGSTGRSAAELSANFIFFPFSFQKKALTHIGKWLNDDLGRSIILHDALKSYEYLDEKFNLDERWRDHVPYLQMLQRLNLFAYGISPGRFGGINSQLFEGAGKVAWNAFIPVGTNIRDASAAKELQDLGRQLTPVWNDINWMLHDTREVAIPVVAGAFTPMSAQSYSAQVGDGWADYNRVRDDFEVALAERGYTLADIHSKPWLAEVKADYEARIYEISQKYPAWFEARTENPGNAIALEMEKDNYMQGVLAARINGVDPPLAAAQVDEMQRFIDGNLERMQLLHGTLDPQFAPPELFTAVRNFAVELADRNPGFRDLWKRFWQRDWGLIDEPMVLP